MTSPDVRIAHLAERQHGVFSRAQALGAGLSSDAIDCRVRSSRWRRIYRGVYAITGVPESFEARAMAANLAAGKQSCVSHTTAATIWRLSQGEDLHVTVMGRKRVRVDGVIVHRPVNFSRSEITTFGLIRVTRPERTLIDLAEVLDVEPLEDALDEALRRHLVDADRMSERIRSMSRNGRRGVADLEGLLTERCGRAITESSLENRFRRLLRASPLPQPVEQYRVYTADGTLFARIDFAYPEAKIAVEVDGYAFHAGRRRWQNDRDRQNHLVALGWLPLRFTSKTIDTDPPTVLSTIASALASRGFGSLTRPRDGRKTRNREAPKASGR